MDYTEFKRQLGKANVSVRGFAELLGKHPNSITNRSKSVVPQHLAVIATLMASMAEHGVDFEQPLLRVRGPRMKARGAFGKRATSKEAVEGEGL